MFNELNYSIPEATIDTDNLLSSKFENFIGNSLLQEHFNNFSQQLQAIINYLKNISEVNEARVLYFKAEIALGKYQSNSDEIAMKMLNLELA